MAGSVWFNNGFPGFVATLCPGCFGGGGGGGGVAGVAGVEATVVAEGVALETSLTSRTASILGIPNGLPTSPWGTWGAIIPSANCGDITCAAIGMGLQNATNAAYNPSTFTLLYGLLQDGGATLRGWLGNTGDPNDTRRLFNTKWCGPGGGGTPVNNLDNACMQHDVCYETHHLSYSDNFDPNFSNGAALQTCNQQLCNAASGMNTTGADAVVFWFSNRGFYTCH